MLRTFGNVGAAIVVMATFVAWYDFQVALAVPGAVFVVPVSLWSLYPAAAGLLCAGAAVVLLIVNVPSLSAQRAAGAVACALGAAITVYSAVRIFDIPDLGVFRVPRPGGGAGALAANTDLDGGPFLALIGGFMLILGALPVLATAVPRVDQRRVAAA
jgi:hypothetical protein